MGLNDFLFGSGLPPPMSPQILVGPATNVGFDGGGVFLRNPMNGILLVPPLFGLYDPLDAQLMPKTVADAAAVSHDHWHFKKGAVEAAEEVLRNNRFLGFLPDQNAGRKGVFVDFFGKKASTVS